LVGTNEQGYKRLESLREDLGNPFDSRVLKGNRPEVLRFPSVVFFREKNKVRTVQALNFSGVGVEGVEERVKSRGSGSPRRFEEERAKAVRPRTGVDMHMMESLIDFRPVKGISEVSKVKSSLGVEIFETKPPDGES
jgi:hypothetical protein